ncbi:hypothetical protein BDF20DRAFT_862932 [Mycotypha africana]|uniref:uncharacterized protein n=1 Tax=Mycotypha africana TaxID=64632 RepID=UPI002300C2FB|nr:uncharacterized protein BDF20DRAFT_862932 [Mycotypha africana]KAI8981738.1 hypothetical protein BDF20DRAFT_862932 [Mycotypha africana]
MSVFDNNPYASLDDDELNVEQYSTQEDDENSLYSYDAEAEWEESKQQINALFSVVVFPFVGKWLGKKFSFWLWARFLGARTPFSERFGIPLSSQLVHSMKRIAA